MQTLEVFLRFSAVTLLLVQVAMIARDARDVGPARFGILLALSVVAVVLLDGSFDFLNSTRWRFVLAPWSSMTLIFIWWFSLSLFDDEFRLGRREWAVAALYFGLGLLNLEAFVAREPPPVAWAGHARTVISLAIAAHIAYRALRGRQADLVERRRRIRAGFALAIVALLLLDLVAEDVFGTYDAPLLVRVSLLVGFWGVIVWSFFWLGRFDKHVLMFDAPPVEASTSSALMSAKEQAIHEKLIAVIEDGGAYLEPDLSITALAARMQTPEHQLRAHINKSMGYRNFRAFLNHYRLKTAKAALTDRDKAALPILTIAMDAGFASLASFNRAFKRETGQTPSAYRKAQSAVRK